MGLNELFARLQAMGPTNPNLGLVPPGIAGLGSGPDLGISGFLTPSPAPTIGGSVNDALRQMLKGGSAPQPEAEEEDPLKGLSHYLNSELKARDAYLKLIGGHKAKAPKIEKPKLGTGDLITGLIPALALSLLNKDAGAAYAQGYTGGKVEDANRRTEQNRLDAQASEADFQRRAAMAKLGLDFASQDRHDFQNEQRYQEGIKREAGREAKQDARTMAQSILSVAASLPTPTTPAQVPAWAQKMRGLYTQVGKIPGNEAWLQMIPDERQVQQDLQLAIDAERNERARKERDSRAKHYESSAVGADDAWTKSSYYTRAAMLYDANDPERQRLLEQAEHWKTNKTPQEDNKTYQRGRDAAGDARNQFDFDIRANDAELSEIGQRAAAGSLLPGDEARWRELQTANAALRQQRRGLTGGQSTRAQPGSGGQYKGNGKPEITIEGDFGGGEKPLIISPDKVRPLVVGKTAEQKKATDELRKLGDEIAVFMPKYNAATSAVGRISKEDLDSGNSDTQKRVLATLDAAKKAREKLAEFETRRKRLLARAGVAEKTLRSEPSKQKSWWGRVTSKKTDPKQPPKQATETSSGVTFSFDK